MLLDETDKIVAMIDWEYTYAAPTQFILDPRWWLLLDIVELWADGMDDWTDVYDARLKIWLSSMERAEEALGEQDSMPAPLSTYMRES